MQSLIGENILFSFEIHYGDRQIDVKMAYALGISREANKPKKCNKCGNMT